MFSKNGSVVVLEISDNKNSGLIPVMFDTTKSFVDKNTKRREMPLVSGQGSSTGARLF